ncbi:MAG: O-antigen ligase family protein [Deltaproteobacteria bacterium]|nr:O-antigen ligase family protein [Deltaproteobacteria bacterium]
MTDALPRRWPFSVLVATVSLATCVALVAGAGNPALAIAPVLLATIGWAVLKLPLRYTLSAVFLAVLTIDNPQERPAAGLWKSPLYPVGSLLFENLSKHTGIDALRFALLDLLLVALVFLAVMRGLRSKAGGEEVGPSEVSRPAGALTGALVLAIGGLLIAETWGVVRGGDLKASLWQVRQLAAYPVLTLLFVAAYRGPEELAAIGKMVIGAAAFRTLEGLYFYEVICRPQNLRPPYVTSHSDTMLFVLAVMLLVVYWHEARTRKSLWALVFAGLWIMGGVYMNGRRLGYVALAVALLAVFLLAPRTRLKRAISRATVVAVPLAVLYVLAGWNQSGGIFRPAQMVKSVVSSEADRSTQTRDIENFNLVMTLKTNPLLGTGFGHEYNELSRADDISRLFPQYRLIPHNSFLGLWAFTGLVGFWLLWLPIVVAIFLGVRSYPLARTPTERTLALMPVIMAILYSLQAYGDMGLQSWGGAFLLAVSLATASRLAVSVGAWPNREREAASIQPR